MYRKELIIAMAFLEMYHVLLDVVAVYSPVLRRIQRLNLDSAWKSTVKNLEMSSMSASFGSGELICHVLTTLKQYIGMVIIILSICSSFKWGSSQDVYTCRCVLLSRLPSQVTTAALMAKGCCSDCFQFPMSALTSPGTPLLPLMPEMH